MKFDSQKKKLELGDTLVPDLFILNNMKALGKNDMHVYLYLLYLLKNNIEIDSELLMKNLELSADELKISLDVLTAEGLIQKTTRSAVVIDLKEAEINKQYTPKFDSKVSRYENVIDEKRKACVDAICESFFNGYMSFSWHTDIGNLFNMYGFAEEVMIALFQYCQERKALNRKYLFAVAETWHNGGVHTFEELEAFLDNYEKFNKIKQRICKALGIVGRSLSKYEEEFVKKWIEEYNYDFDIIEEGLKRSTSTTNPTIKYIDAIITSWYKKGYKTVDEIIEAESPKTVEDKPVRKIPSAIAKKKSYQNYTQRDYDDYNEFYDE